MNGQELMDAVLKSAADTKTAARMASPGYNDDRHHAVMTEAMVTVALGVASIAYSAALAATTYANRGAK